MRKTSEETSRASMRMTYLQEKGSNMIDDLHTFKKKYKNLSITNELNVLYWTCRESNLMLKLVGLLAKLSV